MTSERKLNRFSQSGLEKVRNSEDLAVRRLLPTFANALAIAQREQGKLTESKKSIDLALQAQLQKTGEQHPDYLNLLNEAALIAWAGDDRATLEEMLNKATAVAPQIRMQVDASGLGRVSYFATNQPLSWLALVLAERGQREHAWMRLEQSLGRGLLDEMLPTFEQSLSLEEAEHLARLRNSVRDGEERIGWLQIAAGKDQTSRASQLLDAMNAKQQRLMADYANLQAELVRKHGPMAG